MVKLQKSQGVEVTFVDLIEERPSSLELSLFFIRLPRCKPETKLFVIYIQRALRRTSVPFRKIYRNGLPTMQFWYGSGTMIVDFPAW